MSDDGVNRTFEWYRLLVELGNFEVEHARIRFYEQSKLHLAIVGGILGLDAYALSNHLPAVLLLASGVSVFGAVNASAWLLQVNAAPVWESRWRTVAADLENSAEFRAAVGAKDVAAWAHHDLRYVLTPQAKQVGVTPTMFSTFVRSLRVLYIVLALGSGVYGAGLLVASAIRCLTTG